MEYVAIFMNRRNPIYFEPGRKPLKPLPLKRNYRKIKIIFAVSVLLFGGFFIWRHKPKEATSEIILGEEIKAEESLPEEAEEKKVSYKVCEGDIPAKVFSEYGKLDANDTLSLLTASKDVYDFTNIKIGRDLEFFFGEKEKAQKIKYFLDSESVIIAETEGDVFKVRKEDIPYATQEEILHVKIDEFLYKDADRKSVV